MSKKGSITVSDFLPYEEYQRLVESLMTDGKFKYALYCILSFALAFRASDVRKLTWGEVIGQNKLVIQEKKTKKVKAIPIGPKTTEKIEEIYYLLGCPNEHSHIFANKYGEDKVMSLQFINRMMKEWKDKYHLKVGNISSHTFRKTFGRYVYDKMGRTEEAIINLQRIFRHSSPQTTMIYIGLRDDEIGQIFENLDF